jgi:hypothetical protein
MKKNKQIKARLEFEKYKAEHPNECHCGKDNVGNDILSALNLDLNNPIEISGKIRFNCLTCGKIRTIYFPVA